MATITLREYNPESGALLANISTLNYGRITAGTHSAVKVIDLAFNEVTEVGNIQLALISSAGITVNSNPTDVTSDGSSSNGQFGIESTRTFDSAKASTPLSRHFAGLNTTITAADDNNVSVDNRSETISDYIYLDVEVDASTLNAGNGAYKVFFDFS